MSSCTVILSKAKLSSTQIEQIKLSHWDISDDGLTLKLFTAKDGISMLNFLESINANIAVLHGDWF